MLLFRLTTKTYLSLQLLEYLPIHVPVYYPTCTFSYFHSDQSQRPTPHSEHRFPAPSGCRKPVLSFRQTVITYLSSHLFYIFTGSISFFNWLYMRTYLSTHLLVWVPIDPPKNWMYLVILMLLVNHKDLPAEPTSRINYQHVHTCATLKTLPVHFYASISKYFNISLIIIRLVCKDFKKEEEEEEIPLSHNLGFQDD